MTISGDELSDEVCTQILDRMHELYKSLDDPETAIEINCTAAINRSGFIVSLFLANSLNISKDEAAKITKDLINRSSPKSK